MSDLPSAESADPDGVQVALRAAHTLWSRGDTAESLKWLRKAAESASDEGADLRSLQLAKAAAELRARLFRASEPPRAASAGGSVPAVAMASFAAPGSSSAPPAALMPGSVAPGESGAHLIVPPSARSEAGPAQALSSVGLSSVGPSSVGPSSAPPAEAFLADASQEDAPSHGRSSRPVTATQYPSHRPRQRMGLLSSPPPPQPEGVAYAAVPSWSAGSERRVASAPPPLPQEPLDDYEELEAEPDDELVDDAGSNGSSGGTESWRSSDGLAPPSDAMWRPVAVSHSVAAPGSAAAPRSAPPGGLPPPLPPRGAFSDDADFTQQTEAQTVVLPLDEEGGARSAQEAQPSGAFGMQDDAWNQPSRVPPSWEPEVGASWAAELHRAPWGNGMSPDATEPAPQSEAARAKLTARVHHQAVRVYLAPDLRTPGQFIVRPLREGEKPAAGERVALLVALEPGVPLV